MNVNIITVGKKSDNNLQNLIDDYQKRLKLKLNWVLIDPPKGSLSNIERRRRESQLINLKLSGISNSYTILLDETGKSFDSIEFSKLLENTKNESLNLNFVIGGAFGVDLELIKLDIIISLSKMVLPHQIVRLILIEQIYRSETIIDNRSYHHL